MVAGEHIYPFGKKAKCFENIAQELNTSNALPWRTEFKHCTDRYRLPLGTYRSNDKNEQSFSGADEEFREREQFLEDIRNMFDDEKARENEIRDADAEKKRSAGCCGC